MRALTNSPLQFQAATKDHLRGALKRLDHHSTQSISEEKGGDPDPQQEGHPLIKWKSQHGQHDIPQDFKVDLGLFSRSLSFLGYFNNLHFFSVVKTKVADRREDSVRI